MKPRDYICLLLGVIVLPVLVLACLTYYGWMMWAEAMDDRRT